jgi:hypothetical protein
MGAAARLIDAALQANVLVFFCFFFFFLRAERFPDCHPSLKPPKLLKKSIDRSLRRGEK